MCSRVLLECLGCRFVSSLWQKQASDRAAIAVVPRPDLHSLKPRSRAATTPNTRREIRGHTASIAAESARESSTRRYALTGCFA